MLAALPSKEVVSSLVVLSVLGELSSSLLLLLLCFASRSVTCTPNSFCRLASLSSYDSVSVLEIVLMVSAALLFGFQSMGQRTPCLATAWKASNNLSASRTLLPTVRLLSVTFVMLVKTT
jgi:hypothetical protein